MHLIPHLSLKNFLNNWMVNLVNYRKYFVNNLLLVIIPLQRNK